MGNCGWISLSRSILDHWVYKDKPFNQLAAWVDILLQANHKDNKFPLGNEIVTVERGSFITSELQLMDRWGWSKSKTRRFLSLLENDGMIVKKTDRKKTTINVVNYGIYQDTETTKRPIKDQSQTDSRPIKDTNNNDNNVNNDNNNKNSAKNNSEIEDFFESVWSLYPNKKGKAQVSLSQKKKLFKIGYDEIKRTIDRYNDYLKKNDWLHAKNGSTFFNSGYVDYLDESCKEQEEEKKKLNDEWGGLFE